MYGNNYLAPAPEPPRKRHHWLRNTLITLGAVVTLIVVLASLGGHPAARPAAATPSPVSTPPAGGATPGPDGTFTGSCAYDLGSDPADGTAAATGDIETVSTGNTGITVRLTITWPQEGYAPLSESKTVRVADGGSLDTQFSLPLTPTQLDNLQNYQLGHSGTGCTYNGAITGTFGPVN